MTVETDLDDLVRAHSSGAAVIDVREPDEYAGGHIPGAVNIPLGQVPANIADVPTDQRVFVVCASGNRSRDAVDTLRASGLDAVSVRGGTKGWVEAGRAVAGGTRP